MINTARKTFRTIAAHGARAALIGSIALAAQAGAAPDIILPHVHGLTYDASGAKLYVAVHDGLVIYSAGRWSRGPEPRNDYMGFAGTRKQFFSSGHPAPGSGMVNPLGLMQSTDGAQSWTQRGLQGESDFHLLAAGFESGAVYVYNPAPNSKMKQAGIYYTLNQGFAWQHAAGQNLPGKLSALAVHPTDPATVAASTTAGVFLSRDYGARFEPLAPGQQSLGLQFDFDGKSLG
ncbi:MAG: F510_1955 family glycosylhydrolase, partial [Burkholderiales bacterium]